MLTSVIRIVFIVGSFSTLGAWAAEGAKMSREEAAARLESKQPWALSRARQGFTRYPGATMHPVLGGEQTNFVFDAGIEQIRPDYSGAPHVHYEKAETIIITEGRVYVRVDGADMTLTEGDFLHIPPGNVHSFNSDDKNAEWVILHHPGSPTRKDLVSLPDEQLYDMEYITSFFENNVHDFYMVPEAGYPYGFIPERDR